MPELAGVMVGNYFLLECLGREGMVESYRARPTTRGGYDVALRLFRPAFPDPGSFQEHFASEVEKVWRYRHEHIQPLLEFGAGEGLLYTATLLTESETLEQLLEHSEDRPLPVPVVMKLVSQLCAALQYAHEHEILHGNIQPSSILLQENDSILLTNFSMKHAYSDGEPAIAQVEEGNAAYAAPEQVVGMPSPASDIYAVGVLLYRLLTGHLPYEGKSAGEIALKHANEPIPSLRQLRPDLPESLELVIRVALAKSSAARFPSPAALAEALLAAIASDKPPVIATSPQRRIFVRSRRTHLTWTRALSLLAIVLVLFGLVGTMVFFSTLPLHLQDIPGFPFHNLVPSGANESSQGGAAPNGSTGSPGASTTGGSQPVIGGSGGTEGRSTPSGGLSQTPTIYGTPPSTPSPFACIAGALSIDGSSNLKSLLQQVSNDYAALCPQLNISLRGDGNRASLNLLQRGQVDVAASDLTAGPRWRFSDHQMAALLYTLIASPDVQISGLSSAQIEAIYQGKITNWAQIGGPNESVRVVLRPASDAVTPIFRAFVVNGTSQHVKGIRLSQDSPGLVVQTVASLQGAISYVPLAAAQGAGVHVLAIDGVSPSAQALLAGSYAFWSVEHLYTSGDGTTQFQGYLQFCNSEREGNIMAQFGAVPARMIDPGILASHLPGPQIN